VLRTALPGIYNKWAALDPVAAATHAASLGSEITGTANTFLSSVLGPWAKSDPDAALAWIDSSFSDDAAYVAAVTSVLKTLRYRDPAKTAKLLERIPFDFKPDTAGDNEVGMLLSGWVRKDLEGARAWVEGLGGSPALQVAAVKSLASDWAARNFNDALQWSSSLADSDLQAYALSSIALRQARTNMRYSEDWILGLPAGFTRTRAAAAYTLGRLMQVGRRGDDEAAKAVKAQLDRDALDPAALRQVVTGSRLGNEEKQRLLALLQ
jgi:hypothetical protein